jgi:hypothetical protein
LRAAGPLVEVAAPAGGRAWIVTEEGLAREVLSDPRIAKDPAFAPLAWDPISSGLEQTAAEQPSLTTLDGPEHTRLRRAHAPLLSAKRVQAQSGRIHEIARELLADLASGGGTVDLMDGFTTRFPLTVLLDLLGIPLGLLDDAVGACRRMSSPEPGDQAKAIAAIADLAAAGLSPDSRGLAAELRDRMPPETTEDDLRYHLFALIFAGQLTTDAALGFLVAATSAPSRSSTATRRSGGAQAFSVSSRRRERAATRSATRTARSASSTTSPTRTAPAGTSGCRCTRGLGSSLVSRGPRWLISGAAWCGRRRRCPTSRCTPRTIRRSSWW